MGSPVSVVTTEFMRQYTEKTLLENAPYQPKICRKDVDDIILKIKKNKKIDGFLKYMKILNQHIKFTSEI